MKELFALTEIDESGNSETLRLFKTYQEAFQRMEQVAKNDKLYSIDKYYGL